MKGCVMHPTEISRHRSVFNFKMMTRLGLMLIYVAFIAGLATTNGVDSSDKGWHNLSTKRIWLSDNWLTWDDSKQICQGKEAHLLEIESSQIQEEVKRVLDLVKATKIYWIGIRKVNEEYVWASNNQKGNYTNWKDGYQYHSCGAINGQYPSKEWITESCDTIKRRFICEKKLDDPDNGGDEKEGTESGKCVNTSLTASANKLEFKMSEGSSATSERGIFSIQAGEKAEFTCTLKATPTPCLQMYRDNEPQQSYPPSYQQKGDVAVATFTIPSIDPGHGCRKYTCGAQGGLDLGNTERQLTLCAPFKPKRRPLNLTIIPHDEFIEVYLLFESYPLISSSSLLVDEEEQPWESILDENEMNAKGLPLNGSSPNSLHYFNRVQLFVSRRELSQKIPHGNTLKYRAKNIKGHTDYDIQIGDVTSSTSSSDDNNTIHIVVAVIAIVVALLLVITVAIFIIKRSKRSTATPTKSPETEKKQTPLNPEKDDGRFVSDDGLVYVTVEHAKGSKKEPEVKPEVKPEVTATAKPEPRFERVEYVALDFQKSGKMQVSE